MSPPQRCHYSYYLCHITVTLINDYRPVTIIFFRVLFKCFVVTMVVISSLSRYCHYYINLILTIINNNRPATTIFDKVLLMLCSDNISNVIITVASLNTATVPLLSHHCHYHRCLVTVTITSLSLSLLSRY